MNRTTAILAALLAVLVIVWALVSINPHHVTVKASYISTDTSRVDYVHIRNKDGEITMKRVGGTWRITDPYDYPANPSYMQTLLRKIADLKLESLITSNKDKYENYEVEGDEASYVEVGREGGTIDSFYCGKPSKTYTHTYMRKADSDEIWLVAGTPRSSFTRKPKDWRDKKILRLDKTLLERVVLKFPDETVQLRRTITTPDMDTTLAEADTSWLVIPQRGKPFKPVDKVMNRIRNTVGRMNAMDFLVSGTDTIPDFSKPLLTVDIFLEGDQHETVDFVADPDSENKYVARKNANEDTVFLVYQSTFNNLSKRADDFKEKEQEKKAK